MTIAARYDREYLVPNLGETNIRKTLLEGLERILNQEEAIHAASLDEKPVDYNGVYEIAERYLGSESKPIATRVATIISASPNYKSLIDRIKENATVPYRGIRHSRIKGLGKKGIKLLYTYLKEKGIYVFEDSYLPDEILPSNLDRKIDYKAMLELGPQNRATKLKAALDLIGVKTYRQLLDYSKVNANVRSNDVRELCLKGVGNRSLKTLYTHLDNLGIQLFDGGYRPEEIIRGV